MPHSVVNRLRLPNPHLRIARQQKLWKTWDKGLITINFDLTGMELWVASVHCYPFHEFGRRPEDPEFDSIWRTLADAVNHIPGAAIVAGDFNTDSRTLFTRLLLDRSRLVSSFEGIATHGERSVDDILYDSKLTRNNSRVTPNFSDHAFCQADFSFRRDLRCILRT